MKKQKNLIVEVDPRLVPVLRRSFPKCKFCGYNEHGDKGRALIKHHASIFSLPKYYFDFQQEDKLVKQKPFLVPDAALVEKFKAAYKNKKDKLVGISWFTSNPKSSALRSLPEDVVLQLTKIRKTKFISLQHGVENSPLRKNKAIFFDSNIKPMESLEDLVAQIAAMDFVITIDNSVAYIAGALGKKTYLLLPEIGNWPWEIRKMDNNFFPSVKVIQQGKGQSWASLAKSFIKANKRDFRRKIK